MFRKSVFLSVTLMAMFYLATNPSILLAQGRGRTNLRVVPPMSRFNFSANPRLMDPRFDRFSPTFDRRLLDRRLLDQRLLDQRLLNSRFDRLSPLDRRLLDPRLNMVNPTLDQFLLERRFAGF